jgi:hypothetical protein
MLPEMSWGTFDKKPPSSAYSTGIGIAVSPHVISMI